jgi:hypothetical protein
MVFFSTWIVPPLVGAVIGYITNWLAIKMLFRPLREMRVFGLRLPFTPGLLPRERKRISKSLGDTVAVELLTADVVRKRLAEPDIRSSLVSAIDGRLESALAGRAADALPKGGVGLGPVARLVAGAWSSLASSEAFRLSLDKALRRAFVLAEEMPLSRFLPPERAGELASLILSPANVEGLRAKLRDWLDGAYSEDGGGEAEAGPALGALIPPEAVEPLLKVLVEGLYCAALPVFEGFLNEPEVKADIGAYSKDVVRSAISRLNMFQRLIVGAAQYERSLAEGMPETVDGMVATAMKLLRDPDMPGKTAEAALNAYRKAQAGPFGRALAGIVARGTAEAALDAAIDALAEHGPGVAERAAAIAAAKADASLASFLASLGLPAEELSSRGAAAISRALSGQGDGGDASRLLGASLSAFVEALGPSLGEASLGEALGAGPAARAELSAFLADKALELVSREAGRIVEGLDVSRIVAERIDALDMAEVERMIVAVVDKELTWITVLGGVLGGFIGIFQSFFAYLSR